MRSPKEIIVYMVAIAVALIAKVLMELGITRDIDIPHYKTSFVIATIFRSLTFASICGLFVYAWTTSYYRSLWSWIIGTIIGINWLIKLKEWVEEAVPKVIDALIELITKKWK